MVNTASARSFANVLVAKETRSFIRQDVRSCHVVVLTAAAVMFLSRGGFTTRGGALSVVVEESYVGTAQHPNQKLRRWHMGSLYRR